MEKYIPAERLPVDEKVYLKKDFLGWRVVHPIKDENNKINWVNLIFGGKRNFFILIMAITIVMVAIFSYSHDVNAVKDFYAEIAHNPETFCNQYMQNGTNIYNPLHGLNLSDVNLTMEGSNV